MKSSMKILFTSIGRRVELIQAFRSAAEKLSLDLEILGADISASAPALQFCDRSVLVPCIKEPSYIPTLLELCEREGICALIPTIDTDLLLLARHKADFARVGTTVAISAEDRIAICRDKRLTAEYFCSLGLKSPVPVDDVSKYNFGYPAFIKPKDGSSSINAYKVENEEELITYAAHVPDYIVQKFVAGTEYTVDIFCDFEGNPIFITPRIRRAVRAGEVLKTEIAQEADIIEQMQRLIENYKPCGPLTVQLIREAESGENYYIEINPRFGGGAPLSMKAGADAATAFLRLLRGETLSYQAAAAENGAVFSRFDQSVRVK